MRTLLLTVICFFVFGCNLPKWYQAKLNKKFARNGVEEKLLKKNGHSIHYYEGGEGPVVLLIHGFGGDAQTTWHSLIIELSENYHVIAPDLLWFGLSSSSHLPNLDSQVDAMFTLLNHCKVDSGNVIGMSYGGFVTLALVNKHRELIDKICIADSPGMTFNANLLDSLAKEQDEESYQDIFVLKSPNDLQQLYNLTFYKKRHIPKGILNDAYEMYFTNFQEEQRMLMTSLRKSQTDFQNISIENFPKSMVIWGAEDHVFPVSQGKKLANYIGASFVEIPNAGHASNLDNKKEFNNQVKVFFAN
ncbi:MAG: hypothetical protein CL840_09060 [Crocinitomicaceae bacterium]|nr:hypothetical protein [Crocinitomicaceae bacterium]|tara:strand:- start:2593 stop:3501 length:909 start_codon:yes stop_codon:yes gene_type:complete